MQIKHAAWCGLCVGVLGCGSGDGASAAAAGSGGVGGAHFTHDSDGDRHVVAVNLGDCRLYELYRAFPEGGAWHADSGAVFDLKINDEHPFTFTSEPARVICAGLERYGMIVADNGSDWYLSGAPDPRWDDDALGDLKQIVGDAFEVVDTGPIETY